MPKSKLGRRNAEWRTRFLKAAMRAGFVPVTTHKQNLIRERAQAATEREKQRFFAFGGEVQPLPDQRIHHKDPVKPRRRRDKLDHALLDKFQKHRKQKKDA